MFNKNQTCIIWLILSQNIYLDKIKSDEDYLTHCSIFFASNTYIIVISDS